MKNIFRWAKGNKEEKPLNETEILLCERVNKGLNAEFTAAEIFQLKDWTSISIENKVWLDKFYNSDSVDLRTESMQPCDMEKYRNELNRRIDGIKKKREKETGFCFFWKTIFKRP